MCADKFINILRPHKVANLYNGVTSLSRNAYPLNIENINIIKQLQMCVCAGPIN